MYLSAAKSIVMDISVQASAERSVGWHERAHCKKAKRRGEDEDKDEWINVRREAKAHHSNTRRTKVLT